MERINVESNSVISPFGRNPSHCSYQWQIWAHMLYIARRMRLAVSNIFTCRASNQTERKVLIVQPDLEWVEGADSRRGLISECECWNCQESHNLTTQVWRPHRKPRWCGHTLHRLRTEQKRRERNQQFKKPLCQSGAGAGRQRNTCDIVTADDVRGQTLDPPWCWHYLAQHHRLPRAYCLSTLQQKWSELITCCDSQPPHQST